MKVDLHMHSCFSHDGELTPYELIEKLHDANITIAALCDHDSVKGVDEMLSLAPKYDITIIPGIEFTTIFEGLEVHLLGYGIDIHHSYFQTIGEHVKKLMNDALHERVLKFETKYKIHIDEEKCLREANGSNPFYNIVDSMILDPANKDIEDFQDYLPGGKRCSPRPVNFYWDKCQPGSDLYVPVNYPGFTETVKIIHDAGGLAVLAHPWKPFYQKEELLLKARQAGIDGMEAYSNYHEPEHNLYYEAYCKQHDLLITCGSDFHGKKKPDIHLGRYGYPKDDQSELIEGFLKKLTIN